MARGKKRNCMLSLGILVMAYGMFAFADPTVLAPGEEKPVSGMAVCLASDPRTFTDSEGLVWRKLPTVKTWSGAVKACEDLNTSWLRGWTIPSASAVKKSSVKFNFYFWIADRGGNHGEGTWSDIWYYLAKNDPKPEFKESYTLHTYPVVCVR